MQFIYLHAEQRCQPCRDMTERFNTVKDLHPDWTLPTVINVDIEPEAAARYGYEVVPTLLVVNQMVDMAPDGTGVPIGPVDELWRSNGRISATQLEYVWGEVERNTFDPQQFPVTAPSADVVFYRTYSRRNGDGQRESWAEAVSRVGHAIADLGRFSEEQRSLVVSQALAQRTMPSGRWLWVGGTEWIETPDNYSGAYNCTSTNITDLASFGLLMDLAMMGSGTGAVLEDDMVAQLPPVWVGLNLVDVGDFGSAPGHPETRISMAKGKGEVIITVGDSRKGWVDAYQAIIDFAHDRNLLDRLLEDNHKHLTVMIDLSQVRPAGAPLKGFGGTANPSQLPRMFRKVVQILNDARGMRLSPVQACLLIDAAAACVVAGNIRRSAGMRQFSSSNQEAATAKQNLYQQDGEGNWSVDVKREDLRMANHTRCWHSKPRKEDILAAVQLQFHTGEGAIQYVPESIARASADLLVDQDDRNAFMECYGEGVGREFLCSLIDVERPDISKEEKEEELDHRMRRYGLNPCGEIIGSDFHCNLAEVHLNQLDFRDMVAQEQAFRAAALQVCALLHHDFQVDRYAYSRMLDPIVGVSFTGLFDFFANTFGREWLEWMAAGRPETGRGPEFASMEAGYLQHWRTWVEDEIRAYCADHNLKAPNRSTTVQPAGTKSLLTGASSGWHPPKATRFIRRITTGREDPVALAAMRLGFNVIPAQSARDEEGRLLNEIYDERVREWLIEIPTEVSWAEAAEGIDVGQLPIAAQWGLYMQVQQHYTTHNTSATLELTEEEIPEMAGLIHDAIQGDKGYISAALLARFDATGGAFPRLPFEPISKDRYADELVAVSMRRVAGSFSEAMQAVDDGRALEAADGSCSNAACVAAAEKAEMVGAV